MNNIRKLTIKQLKEGLSKKHFTASELVKTYLEAIKQHNPQLNAYVHICEEQAMMQAKVSDKRLAQDNAGNLEGIPIAVKDLFCTKNIPTTACSNIIKNFVPPYESTVTQNMFNNGAIMLGKTNMDEFAMGSANITSCFGVVNGPWHNNKGQALTPGGSSGGSSAAVASLLAPGALGSDTGGSVRQPASFTGTVGFKPSYGRSSRFGMIAFASSLDQAGVITKSVEDAALLAESIMGHDNKDSTIANKDVPKLFEALQDYNIRGMKIGIPLEYKKSDLPSDIIKMWENAITYLKQEGALIKEVSLPNTKHALSAYYIIAPAEVSSNLSRYDGIRYGHRAEDVSSLDDLYIKTRSQGFGTEVKRRILIGTYVLSSGHYEDHFLQAQKVRTLIINDFNQVFQDCDAIITPTCISDAFPVESKLTPLEMYHNDLFTIPASLAGLPCISIPGGLSDNALPLGLQIIGRKFDEVSTLKVAHFLERNIKFTAMPGGIDV